MTVTGIPDTSQNIPPGISSNPDDSFNPDKLRFTETVIELTPRPEAFREEKSGEVKINAWLVEDPRKRRKTEASDTSLGKPAAPTNDDTKISPELPDQILPDFPQFTRDDSGESLLMPSDYLLKKIVGEGGCGEVWEGVQHSINRVVAVKRLRPEKYGEKAKVPKVIRFLEQNFRHEALTTAHLEHPNIVPVYDLGTDEKGMPLLAMKLVRGRRWTEIVDEDRENMTFSDLLNKHLSILVDVTQAVAFAHSRGIIHRDIKPSQVMIGEFGEVLLMDWGLSLIYDLKLVREQAPDFANPDYTPTGKYASSPAGTPAYMAPEQTSERAHDVGTWTDIYLLGGTLYYILTGSTPNKGSDSTEAFDFATNDTVEPPEVRVRNHEIPGELSRLAMYALRRDPNDRISTALGFLEGLKNFQTGAGKRSEALDLLQKATEKFKNSSEDDYQAIEECANMLDQSISLWSQNDAAYRLQQKVHIRYARQAITSRDLNLARMQAERLDPSPERKKILEEIDSLESDQRTTDARIEDAYRQVNQARKRAESARNEAEDLVRYMLQDLFVNLQVIKRTDVLDNVAQRALHYFEQNPDKEQTAETLEQRALTLRNIGNVFANRGKIQEAIKAYNDSQEIFQVLFRREPENNRWRLALSIHHEKIARMNVSQEKLNNALRAARLALDIRQRLASQSPEDAEYMSALADSYNQEAEILFEYDQPEAALESFSKARSICEMVFSENPENLDFAGKLAVSHLSESKAHHRLGNGDKAKHFAEQSIRLWENLHKLDKNNRAAIAQLSDAIMQLGLNYEGEWNYGDAESEFRKALTLMEDLYYNDPTHPLNQTALVAILMSLGRCYVNKDQVREALDVYERAITIERQAMTTLERFEKRHYLMFLELYLEVTEIYLDVNSFREARKCTKLITKYFERLGNPKPDSEKNALLRARSMVLAGRISIREQNATVARKVWENARSILDSWVQMTLNPGDHHAWIERALVYLNRTSEAEQIRSDLETVGYKNSFYYKFLKRNNLIQDDGSGPGSSSSEKNS